MEQEQGYTRIEAGGVENGVEAQAAEEYSVSEVEWFGKYLFTPSRPAGHCRFRTAKSEPLSPSQELCRGTGLN